MLVGLVTCSYSQTPAEQAKYIEIARKAVVAAVQGSVFSPKGNGKPVPVFVTIERKGAVIGCRGSLKPRSASLEQGIADAARSAAQHDPRYRPLQSGDLKEFLVTVTLVQRLEPLRNVSGLTREDGLVLTQGSKVGIVLPWEGKDPKVRLSWAYRKAGVLEGSDCKLERLVAVRFRG